MNAEGIFMETNEKIKRVNPLFALGYIGIPIAAFLILSTIAVSLIKTPVSEIL